MDSAKKLWIVTGASSGLGAAIALAAARAGNAVIGTARNPEKAAQDVPEFEKLGGKWLKLDVSKPEAQEIVANAVREAGRVDVLVNNAGTSEGVGLMEDVSIETHKAAMEINFYGPLRCIKAVLPTMRAQKSGCIVNHGSIIGHVGTIGCATYSTSKFALEALSEAFQVELVDFNIRTIHLTTGYFQTDIVAKGMGGATAPQEAYLQGAVGEAFAIMGPIATDAKNHPGDPEKFGARLAEIVDGTGAASGKEKTHWVPFGKDALWTMRRKAERLTHDAQVWEELALSTDVDGYDESLRMWPDKLQKFLL